MNELPLPPIGKSGWPWTDIPEPLPETMPDGSTWPKISVVTPSFHQGQFIEEAIRSVLLQGYPNLEFIIIDGGSKDYTIEIIKKYEPWIHYWVSEPDRGQSHAVNKGILRSTGSIIFWLNSDDYILPGAFSKIVCEFLQCPVAKMIIGQARVINSKGEIIGDLPSEFSTWEDIVTTPINRIRQVSAFFSRTLFDEFGLIDETLEIAMDNELLTRFSGTYPPKVIPDYLAAFRSQPDSKSFKQRILGYREVDKIRQKLLRGNPILSKYKAESAKNWLENARPGLLPLFDRLYCLLSALKLRPRLIFTKDFWRAFVRSSIHPQKQSTCRL